MKSLRNVVTLSNIDVELEQWARDEAKRRNKPFYQVVNEALEVLRRQGQKADEAGADPQGQTSPVLS